MATKIDIVAPQIEQGSSALTLSRWLKNIGDPVAFNEPIAEIIGAQARGYVHAPTEGTVSSLYTQPGQNILSGSLMGKIAVVSKNAIDWTNFDQVTVILEEYADNSNDPSKLKDANEALGQLLGVTDVDVFRKLSIEEQNKFLQNLVDQSSQGTLGGAEVAQKLLEGLHLRNPQPQGPAVRGPAMGVRIPTPGGMGMGGGGGQQQYYQPPPPTAYPPQQPMHPQHQQQWPHQPLPNGYPPFDPYQAGAQPGHWSPPPHVPHISTPPNMPPQAPFAPPPMPPNEDDKK